MPQITTRDLKIGDDTKTKKILIQRTTESIEPPPVVKANERPPAKGPIVTTHNIDSFDPRDRERKEKTEKIIKARKVVKETKPIEDKKPEEKPKKKRRPYKKRQKKIIKMEDEE